MSTPRGTPHPPAPAGGAKDPVPPCPVLIGRAAAAASYPDPECRRRLAAALREYALTHIGYGESIAVFDESPDGVYAVGRLVTAEG